METRWSKQKLKETTNYSQPAAQTKWFKSNFGVDVPRDCLGVIMTDDTYSALHQKRCGLIQQSQQGKQRPKPNLRQA